MFSSSELGNLLREVLPCETPVVEVTGDGQAGQIIHYPGVGLTTNPDVRKVFVQYLEIKVIIRHSVTGWHSQTTLQFGEKKF